MLIAFVSVLSFLVLLGVEVTQANDTSASSNGHLRRLWPTDPFGVPPSKFNESHPSYHLPWDEHPDEKVQKFFHQRKLFLNALNETRNSKHFHNHKSIDWRVIENVNGLKNEDVIVFVTSTVANNEVYLWERIIPSARTWIRYFANVYIILEDNFLARYAMRHCEIKEYEHHTVFHCPDEPSYLLTRKCTNDYYGSAGPCCKVDEAFNYLINENQELFSHIKYLLHGDDDTYFRADAIMDFLSQVEKSGASDLPLVGNNNNGLIEENPGHWHIKTGTCKEIQACGWFQPLMINHAALQLLAHPVSKYAITDTCKAFDMTHDAGLEIFFWLFSFYHIFMPLVEVNPGHQGYEILREDLMIVHNIRHEKEDGCRLENEKKWPANLRYDQKMAIGCGDIGRPGPFHDRNKLADMYDAFEYFRDHGGTRYGVKGEYYWDMTNVTYIIMPNGQKRIKDVIPRGTIYHGPDYVEERLFPLLIQLKGYETTQHSKKHDITSNWVPFKHEDCKIKGLIE